MLKSDFYDCGYFCWEGHWGIGVFHALGLDDLYIGGLHIVRRRIVIKFGFFSSKPCLSISETKANHKRPYLWVTFFSQVPKPICHPVPMQMSCCP